ncbi:cytochrome c oxidase protein 20 homolog isoform X2 [Xiphophorus maculatus]|uniref:cytochrome c oxidase protein 20 homolog isoform X2 n=1 Tax=Xiphophorus maculatus TaxID=8083 RepID=UPI000C6EB655|nr:cytochrome c oxidase protein 20 homolog isoform X2 [Xiphophorus maculatus]
MSFQEGERGWTVMAGEEGAGQEKGFKLLGILDVQRTPCARDAILHGAGGSVAAGMLFFLSTSRVRRSFDVGFAGFMLTTLGSWFYCRMNNAKLRVQQRVIQEGIRNKMVIMTCCCSHIS